jgi:transcriptional regulator with XRE-family HTH domain
MAAILRIKEIMGQKGMSRKGLAESVGVSVTTISNICSETSYPTVELLPKLAKALDCDIRELFISTKGNSVTDSEVAEARELIGKGLNILKGKH